MKVFLAALFSCSVLLCLAPSAAAQGDNKNYYSRRYDSLDVNAIFRNSRLLNNYVDCLLDKKPCPPEGKDLKRVLPDALRTRCARCTELQKQKSLDVITRLYYQHPSIYTALAERYDPTGEYTKNFENWFDEQNVVKPGSSIPKSQAASRIPSTWITNPTTTATIQRSTSSRPTLRTLPPTVRASTQRVQTPPLQRTSSPTFRASLPEATTTQTSSTSTTTFRTTSQTFETIRTTPSTLRPTQSPITAPPTVSTTTTTTTTQRPSTTEAPIQTSQLPIEISTKLFQPPVTIRAPVTVFQAPPIPITEPSTIRTTTQRFETPQTFRTEPATVRVQTRFQTILETRPTNPPPTRPASTTRPTVPTLRDSTVIFRMPATVRSQFVPQQNRPNVPQNFQPTSLIDNFFIPNRNGPFRRSIDRILNTSEQVINNVAGMVRSTIEVITGTGN